MKHAHPSTSLRRCASRRRCSAMRALARRVVASCQRTISRPTQTMSSATINVYACAAPLSSTCSPPGTPCHSPKTVEIMPSVSCTLICVTPLSAARRLIISAATMPNGADNQMQIRSEALRQRLDRPVAVRDHGSRGTQVALPAIGPGLSPERHRARILKLAPTWTTWQAGRSSA